LWPQSRNLPFRATRGIFLLATRYCCLCVFDSHVSKFSEILIERGNRAIFGSRSRGQQAVHEMNRRLLVAVQRLQMNRVFADLYARARNQRATAASEMHGGLRALEALATGKLSPPVQLPDTPIHPACPELRAGGTPKRKAVPHTPARPRLALGTPAHALGPKGRPQNALRAHGPIARAGSGHQRACLIKVFTGFETHKGHDFIVQ